jgi:sodium transport system permease protein
MMHQQATNRSQTNQRSLRENFNHWRIQLCAVFSKEWRDTWKDRRGTQSALMFALLGPFVVIMLLQSMIASSRDESMPKLALVGGEHWPALEAQLSVDFQIVQAHSTEHAVQQLMNDQIDLVLTIPERVDADIKAGKTITMNVAIESARSKSQAAASRLRARLQGINDTVTQMRLTAHGVSPTQMQVLDMNLAEHGPSARFQSLTQTMVLMLLLGGYFAGMNVAIDTTAGERERESLEVLLAQATHPASLWLGKYLVVLSFAVIGSLLTIAVLWFGLSKLALYQLPLQLNLTANAWLQIWLATLPFAALMSGLQMAFALFARNYKEAQIYITLLAFLPAGMSLPFAADLPPGLPIPVLQETQWLQLLLRGGELPWLQWWTLFAVVFASVALVLCVSARWLRSERMLAAS